MKEPDHHAPALAVKNLHKSFGPQVVLNGIDLTVSRGETVAVLGRSGTGKSVLLKLIIGLQQPDAGNIEVSGQNITGLSADELNPMRKKMGFLFQQAALYDSLTVEENVAFPLQRHTRMNRHELQDRVRKLLADVGMEKALHKMPADISGGMKKRVGLARALALDPEILLLDEPTGGLDPITTSEIDELICALQQDRQVSSVIVTHDMHSVHRIADRVAMLSDGNIVLEGTLEDLQHSDHPFVRKFRQEAEEEK
jgi:phospholipid/cholesterol/gamma-HCH transport system ATP-binding protein